MTTRECPREQELLDALAMARWPDPCDRELHAHVETCAMCADLVAVAVPLLQEREIAQVDARVPSSAVVWWRAQMRARREAAQTATRPITMIQGVALACAAGLVAGIAGFAQPAVRGWLAWASGLRGIVDFAAIDLTALQAFAPTGMLLVALALWLLIAPVAIYFAMNDE